jgi:hypothetical protein
MWPLVSRAGFPVDRRRYRVASTHRIDPKVRFGMIRFWGRVDGAQLVRDAVAFFNDPDAQKGLYLLLDTREIRSLDLSPDDVQRIADLIHRVGPEIGPTRSAIVAVSPDVYVVARLIKARATLDPGKNLEIFGEVDDALRWLGGDEAETVEAIARVYADEVA